MSSGHMSFGVIILGVVIVIGLAAVFIFWRPGK